MIIIMFAMRRDRTKKECGGNSQTDGARWANGDPKQCTIDGKCPITWRDGPA